MENMRIDVLKSLHNYGRENLFRILKRSREDIIRISLFLKGTKDLIVHYTFYFFNSLLQLDVIVHVWFRSYTNLLPGKCTTIDTLRLYHLILYKQLMATARIQLGAQATLIGPCAALRHQELFPQNCKNVSNIFLAHLNYPVDA